MLKIPDSIKTKRQIHKPGRSISRSKKSSASGVAVDALIVKLLTQFINVDSEDIDEGIIQALKSIGEFADADRAYIFLYSHNRAVMSNTHEWCREGIESQMYRIKNVATNTFSWFEGQMAQKKIVNMARLDQLPEEAKSEKAEFQAQATQSLICVPMTIGEEIIGFAGLDAVK